MVLLPRGLISEPLLYFGNPLVTIHGHIICYLTRLHSYHNVIWHLPHPSRFSGSYDHLTSMLAPPPSHTSSAAVL